MKRSNNLDVYIFFFIEFLEGKNREWNISKFKNTTDDNVLEQNVLLFKKQKETQTGNSKDAMAL